MKKYKVTYNEGDVINKTMILEAKTMNEALVFFCLENPNADFTSIEEVVECQG